MSRNMPPKTLRHSDSFVNQSIQEIQNEKEKDRPLLLRTKQTHTKKLQPHISDFLDPETETEKENQGAPKKEEVWSYK